MYILFIRPVMLPFDDVLQSIIVSYTSYVILHAWFGAVKPIINLMLTNGKNSNPLHKFAEFRGMVR